MQFFSVTCTYCQYDPRLAATIFFVHLCADLACGGSQVTRIDLGTSVMSIKLFRQAENASHVYEEQVRLGHK